MSSLRNALRSALLRAPRAQRADLRGKRAIVTGATPGSLGFETARLIAAWGADVVVSTRHQPEAAAAALRQQLAAEADPGRVEALALDLCQRDSVEQFVARYREHHGDALDLLINNAGVHLDLLSQWQAPRLTADGHEIHWRTNYLGTMHLTHRLLPLLQRTGGARVVNVVSQLHVKGSNAGLFAPQPRYNSWVAYGNSKLALVHATFELQRRHARHGVQAYCLHPGAVYTHIADGGLAGNPWVEKLRRAFAPVEAFFLLTPEEGAQTTLHCASAADAEGGCYYRGCRVAAPSADSRDAAVSARLWQDTVAWVGPDRGL